MSDTNNPCSYHPCKSPISENCNWLRVRLDASKLTKKFPLPIDVGTHGVSAFHQACWDVILHQHKKPNKIRKVLIQANKTSEFFTSIQQVEQQAEIVASLLRQANHAVAFTGAGISTSAGIGDFRGLFGLWTEKELGLTTTNQESEVDEVPYEDLRPTLTHESLAWLIDNDIMKFVMTQNCDGLHRLSGIPKEKLSELHGCVFVEYCRQVNCGREFERNYDVCNEDAYAYYEEIDEYGSAKRRKPRNAELCRDCQLSHRTHRTCPDCNMPLYDTIINFGDSLRSSEMGPAIDHSERSDVMIVLGSTVSVTPASDLCDPTTQEIVVCNRQRTGIDRPSSVRIHGDCDVFMDMLLKTMMGPTEYLKWKEDRPARLKRYSDLRSRDI